MGWTPRRLSRGPSAWVLRRPRALGVRAALARRLLAAPCAAEAGPGAARQHRADPSHTVAPSFPPGPSPPGPTSSPSTFRRFPGGACGLPGAPLPSRLRGRRGRRRRRPAASDVRAASCCCGCFCCCRSRARHCSRSSSARARPPASLSAPAASGPEYRATWKSAMPASRTPPGQTRRDDGSGAER